jgi:hypothetical protein
MLKISTETDATQGKVRLVLEGRLIGPWVEELNRCWLAIADARAERPDVLVDLTGVTFIAPEGKALLASMWQRGVTFHAAGCLTRCIVEEITNRTRERTGT